MIATDLYLLRQGYSDSLSELSFSVIKEPTGTYFVGYPFNKHADNIADIEHLLSGSSLSDDALDKLRNLDTYAVSVFRIVNNVVTPVEVTYLYSIPSYGGGQNGTSNS